MLTNKYNTVLYIGITSNLFMRLPEHKNKVYKTSFTAKYNCDKLVYYETFRPYRGCYCKREAIKEMEQGMEG